MATNTPNYDLIKPAYADAADIADINENMDIIDDAMNDNAEAITTVDGHVSTLQGGLAIVSDNNTHAAITSGQYVYVRGHDTLAEGLYTANSNIAANATLSSSNLTSASGALNALNSKITNNTFATSPYASGTSFTLTSPITVASGVNLLVLFKHFISSTSFVFDLLVITCSGTSLYATYIQKNSQATISSMSYSGKNITINFGQTVYMSAHSIVIQ